MKRIGDLPYLYLLTPVFLYWWTACHSVLFIRLFIFSLIYEATLTSIHIVNIFPIFHLPFDFIYDVLYGILNLIMWPNYNF
jgi:hypothetical protein